MSGGTESDACNRRSKCTLAAVTVAIAATAAAAVVVALRVVVAVTLNQGEPLKDDAEWCALSRESEQCGSPLLHAAAVGSLVFHKSSFVATSLEALEPFRDDDAAFSITPAQPCELIPLVLLRRESL
jgi:hypothetical protein